jgi:hypothetical protein
VLNFGVEFYICKHSRGSLINLDHALYITIRPSPMLHAGPFLSASIKKKILRGTLIKRRESKAVSS